MRQFADGIFDAADILQLTARVAVHQLQAVEHVAFAQNVDQLEYLGDEQAELAALARRITPTARSLAGQLDAHTDTRPHPVMLGMAQDQR